MVAHRPDRKVTIENEGVFDELVLDDWFHLENMAENHWWVRVGDARINVTLSSDGNAVVQIERGQY